MADFVQNPSLVWGRRPLSQFHISRHYILQGCPRHVCSVYMAMQPTL